MSPSCASPITTTGHWDLDRQQGQGISGRRFITNGATRGFIQGVGPTSCIATVFDRNHRRHSRPFWDVTEAQRWVEENA
jgi:hypothetical protein